MDIFISKKMRNFILLAQTNNIARAAEKIHMTASPFGKSIAAAKWHLNRSQFGIRIDHDLASISDHSLASQSITIWHASDH